MKSKILTGLLAVLIVVLLGKISFADTLTAKDLLQEAEANRARFDKNYKEKTITLMGYVAKVEEDDDGYKVTLYGESNDFNPFNSITCYFDASQEDAVFELDKGEEVTLTATYKGKEDFEIGKFSLRDCKVVQ